MPLEYMLMERDVITHDDGDRVTVPGSTRIRRFGVYGGAPSSVRGELIYQFGEALDHFERERSHET
jgi:hypothetical protein